MRTLSHTTKTSSRRRRQPASDSQRSVRELTCANLNDWRRQASQQHRKPLVGPTDIVPGILHFSAPPAGCLHIDMSARLPHPYQFDCLRITVLLNPIYLGRGELIFGLHFGEDETVRPPDHQVRPTTIHTVR